MRVIDGGGGQRQGGVDDKGGYLISQFTIHVSLPTEGLHVTISEATTCVPVLENIVLLILIHR